MVNYAEDERLSLRTKGLMSVLLFLQNKGESPNATNAMKHTTGKYPTVRSGIKELTEMDISNMTPLDAMNELYRLQNKLKNRW